jgi:hypothetical protein
MRKGVNLPGFVVAMMRFMPAWRQLKAVAHTVVYDTIILGDTGSGKPLLADRWASATVPTLVVDGGRVPRGCETRCGRSRTSSPMRGTAPWTARRTW